MQKPREPEERENLGMQKPKGLITINKMRKIVGIEKPRPGAVPSEFWGIRVYGFRLFFRYYENWPIIYVVRKLTTTSTPLTLFLRMSF